MRSVFFGTPAIAVPALEALSEISQVCGVVCQPDRPRGRGLHLTAPEVKVRALELGFEVFQPEKVRDGRLEARLSEWAPDVALVIAYGRILPPKVLALPRAGCLNLHASLLPRYRGAAPIQRALMAGEERTGVCLMKMEEGMDTGPVYAHLEIEIAAYDDAGSLAAKVAETAARLTRDALPQTVRGELLPVPQNEMDASYAPPITTADCGLDFQKPALELEHQVRGLAPKPGAEARLNAEGREGRRFKILAARAMASDGHPTTTPGRVRVDGSRILIEAGQGSLLELISGQLEGKSPRSARELLNGRILRPGDQLFSSLPEGQVSSDASNDSQATPGPNNR